MSVYVDAMMPCIKNKNWRYDQACHLIADTVGELHLFADRLGLKRSWFQDGTLPHYDLTKGMRLRAVGSGAIEINRDELVALLRDHRRRSGGNSKKVLAIN